MRKLCVLVIFIFAIGACGDSDVAPGEDAGGNGDTDVADSGDIEPEPDVDGGVDADGGEDPDPDVDMGQPDGGDVGSGEPDGGNDADAEPSCQEDLDTDADGLSDCDEAGLCTDPTKADTDGDNLSDFEELEEGTSPCKADTDNDGVSDYQEIELGLDPNRAQTFPSKGKPDGELWRVDACKNTEGLGPEDEVLNYYTNDRGNWQIGLRDSFSNYQNLDLKQSVGAPAATAVYGDPLTTVYGLVLSKDAESGQPSPSRAVADSVAPAVNSLPVEETIYDSTGSNFETHGGRNASLGQFVVRLNSEWSAKKVREELLFRLAEPTFGKGDVLDPLPSTAGPSSKVFRIEASVVYRSNSSGPDQALYSVVVTPNDVYDNREQVQFQLSDLVNTTNLAEVPDQPLDGCATFKPDSDIPKADFYWVLDQSGSMGPFTATVSGFSDNFVNKLQGLQLDYRMGVTNMDDSVDGRLKAPGWTRDAQTFAHAVDTGAHAENCEPINGWSCSNGDEYGLQNAKEGLMSMLGLPGAPWSAPPTRQIRSGADVITVFMTDDSSNSIRDGSASPADYTNFFPKHTEAFSIVDRGQGCGSNVAPVYEQVSSQTGSICVGPDNLSGILTAIVNAANAQTSEYKLSQTPISASLQVFVNGNFVPRSESDGFNFFAQYDAIGFYGSYAPDPSETDSGIAEDFVVVEYDYFEDHCKENDQGADNCSEDF